MARKPAWLIWTVLAGMVFMWGSNWILIKVGLSDLPPFTFAGIRYSAAGIILLPVAFLSRASFPRNWHGWLFMAAIGFFTSGLTSGLVFWGEQSISSGLTALLWATNPFITALMAHFVIPAEPLNLRRLGGIIIGFAGVIVVLGERAFAGGRFDLVSELAIVGGASAWAVGAIWFKKAGAPGSPMVTSGIQTLSGGILLLVFAAFVEQGESFQMSFLSGSLLTYMILINTCLVFSLFFWTLKHLDATTLSLTSFMNPILAVLLGALILGESLNWQIALGLPLVGLGLFLVQKPATRRPKPAPSTTVDNIADPSVGTY